MLNEIDKQNNSGLAPKGNKMEIIGYLRRFISQQFDIRETIYEELLALTEENTSIASNILDILWAHLTQYLSLDSTGLNLDLCYSQQQNTEMIREPMGSLLHCCSLVLKNVVAMQSVDGLSKRIYDTLKAVISIYCKLQINDFHPVETGDEATQTGGSAILSKYELVQGVLEALIGHCFLFGDNSIEWKEYSLQLSKRLAELGTAIKESQPKNRGFAFLKEKRISVLNLQLCCPLIENVLNRDTTIDQEFALLGLSSLASRLSSLSKEHRQLNATKSYEYCEKIATAIFSTFLSASSDISIYEKKLVFVAIECYDKCLQIVNESHSEKLEHWIMAVHQIENVQHADDKEVLIVKQIIDKFDERCRYLFSTHSKQGLIIFRCISILTKCFANGGEVVKEWIKTRLFQQSLTDANIVKEIFGLYLRYANVDNENAELLRVTTCTVTEIGVIVGTNEADTPSIVQGGLAGYPIVNENTCDMIALVLLSFFDASFEQMEWCYLHSTTLCSNFTTMLPKAFEEHLLSQIILLINMVGEFGYASVRTAIVEPMLRSLGKAFKLSTCIVKSKSKNADGSTITPVLSQLVQATSVRVTNRLYYLIPYLQQQDYEESKSKKKKRGQKGKSSFGTETKMIPHLIYQIEQFERHLIQLSKKTKVILLCI